MGERGDGDERGHCRDEHWVMRGSVESPYYTPETNTTLCEPTGLK